MQLFYAPDIDFSAGIYTFPEEESRHIVRVLRLVIGDTLHLTDGRGTLACAEITDASPKRCVVAIRESIPEYENRPYRLHLAVAPTKNSERFEWLAEKATEFGLDVLIPLRTERSERRSVRRERLEKIAAAAMKQSLKAYCPEVEEFTAFDTVIVRPHNGQKFIAHCEEDPDKISLQAAVRQGGEVLVLIGPEGDFSPGEIARAKAAGFRSISLGYTRLRTETAALAVAHTVALVNEI